MRKKEERLIALAGLFRKTRRRVTLDEIAQELGPGGFYTGEVEARRKALRRDLAALGELGLVVEYDEARGGYALAEAQRGRRRVDLEPEEAVIAREAAALLLRDEAPAFAPEVTGILERLEAFDHVVQAQIVVHHPTREDEAVALDVRRLAQAIWRRRAVRFTYVYEAGGAPHPRTVDPWGLLSRGGRWYLVGRCHMRDAKRCFRVACMSELDTEVSGAKDGAYSVPEGFDLRAEAGMPRWDWVVHDPVVVRLHVDPDVADLVARRFGGRVEGDFVTRLVTNRDAVWDLAVEWLPRVRIEEPQDLAERWGTWFARIAAAHGGPP